MNTLIIQFKKYICLLLIVSLSLFVTDPSTASANPTITELLENENDDVKDILQSSLSIVELDKEIYNVQEQLVTINKELVELQALIERQETDIQHKQAQSGNILRSYYMGERDEFIWNLLSNFDSWQSLLAAFDYIELILSHDKHILTSYIDQYRDLMQTYEKIVEEQTTLQLLEEKLQEQKARVIALEEQVSEQLAGRTDAERILLLITELTNFWNKEGIHQLRDYFYELTRAMNQFPTWIQQNSQYYEMKGMQYIITLPDDALNSYLREYNEMFNHFEFSFDDNKITASGKKDQIEISISGNYSIVNEPKHYIQFTLEELYFNGFLLPDSTKSELESEFDLNFYPSLIMPFIRAKSVQLSEGQLKIELQLSL